MTVPKKPKTISANDRLRALVDSSRDRLAIYVYIRSLKVYHGVSALCAATQSEYLRRAGWIAHHFAWTANLSAVLLTLGWTKVYAPDALLPLDECFSADVKPKNGSPDHVYLFLYWVDRADMIAMVLDNYSPNPHLRNIGVAVWYKGKRYAKTPFAYALRAPGTPKPAKVAGKVA